VGAVLACSTDSTCPPLRAVGQLIAAATELFLRHGYLGTSMDQVTAAARRLVIGASHQLPALARAYYERLFCGDQPFSAAELTAQADAGAGAFLAAYGIGSIRADATVSQSAS
jgi:hypothetical protein